MSLRIAKGLTFPADAATQTFLVVGKRGSGKSTTAARLVEEMHGARVPFLVLDPVDTWWGLKASKSGGPGLPVYVFGGRHQDAPLESGGGELLADVVIENRISAVLSLKHLSGKERNRFVTDLARRLFQANRDPLHVVLEEAHEFAPQSDWKGSEEMLGAIKKLWKLGRSCGLGGTAVTQRPAALHKDVTTQAEVLVVHRTIGPQDVAAVREWVRYHGEREDILPELANLKTGEAFVWAPDFPEGHPVGLVRVKILPRETFDSAATPKVGERRMEPKELRPVDLERLSKQMSATIERAKAEDPRQLQARVRELERELRAGRAAPPAAKAERLEVPVVRRAEVNRLGAVARVLGKRTAAVEEAARVVRSTWEDLSAALKRVQAFPGDAGRVIPHARGLAQAADSRPAAPSDVPSLRGNGEGGEQRILDVVAMLNRRGIEVRRETVGRWLGLHPGGGRFLRNIASLRASGHLSGWALTESGRARAGHWPTGASSAVEAIKERSARRIMQTVLGNGGELSRVELAAKLGLHPGGGRFLRDLSWLRDMALIPERGPIKATEGALR